MEWYYAEDGQQRGPVNEADFDNLVRAGTIRDDTLIWREGMANWQSYAQVRGGGAAAGAATVTGIICSQCGKTFTQDQMIRYGDAWVCAACKPMFVQRLKEGAAMPLGMQYGGFWIRFAAKFLDNIITNIVTFPLGFVLGLTWRPQSEEGMIALQIVAMALGIVVTMAYTVFFVGRFGATPGKMACKLKVVMPDGSPVSYGRAFGRYFAEILSVLTCLIGYIIAAFDDEKRALHDRICNTRVVKI
jgi:uncharacterized RDD family membrane protein YckC